MVRKLAAPLLLGLEIGDVAFTKNLILPNSVIQLHPVQLWRESGLKAYKGEEKIKLLLKIALGVGKGLGAAFSGCIGFG